VSDLGWERGHQKEYLPIYPEAGEMFYDKELPEFVRDLEGAVSLL
jgi:hypothetical protein